MPVELLIAFVAFGMIPIGLMAAAALVAFFLPIADTTYQNPHHCGSQDYDRRKK